MVDGEGEGAALMAIGFCEEEKGNLCPAKITDVIARRDAHNNK